MLMASASAPGAAAPSPLVRGSALLGSAVAGESAPGASAPSPLARGAALLGSAVAGASAPGATAGVPQISTKLFPEAPERALVVRACAACHAPELVVAKRHTVDEWDDIIAKMIDRGAVANEAEQQQILEYLARFYGPE
jgi:hypothetical protein